MAQVFDDTAGQQIVIATFNDRTQAQAAVDALRARDIPADAISAVVRQDATEITDTEMEQIDREAEAVGTDVAVGGTAGGVVGFLAGLALFSIPGLGPFLGVGVLATTLGGAVIGSAAGQRTAEFRDLGLPEDRAERYSGAFEAGDMIVAVTGEERTAKVAYDVLQTSGAAEVDVHPYRSGI